MPNFTFKLQNFVIRFSEKIVKFVATVCQILRLKCTNFNFGWVPPHTPTKELTALNHTL